VSHKSKIPFELEGQFIRFADECGRPKRILLRGKDGFLQVKLAKWLRSELARQLTPGTLVLASGFSKPDEKSGGMKYKAEAVKLLGAGAPPPPVYEIQICGRGNCWKRGGAALWQALEQAVDERGLGERVSLQKTGCLGLCKQAPGVCCTDLDLDPCAMCPRHTGTFVEACCEAAAHADNSNSLSRD
jgi:hypothetical protein